MKSKFLIFLFLAPLTALYGDSFFFRSNQINWMSANWSKATFCVEPKGLYAECQLLLEVDDPCYFEFVEGDSIEINLNFSLPENVEITDLVLWVDTIPVQAMVIDRWTAASVYNEIVNIIRKDPAILLKQTETDYELRVFPLLKEMPRRFKLTFLIPMEPTGSQPSIELPAGILNLSQCTIPQTILLVKESALLQNPMISEYPGLAFVNETDSIFGPVLKTTLPSVSEYPTLTVQYNQPGNTSVFAGSWVDPGGESYYQVEFDPSALLNLPHASKTLFLIEFVGGNSSYNSTKFLQDLETGMKKYFQEGDSVNLFFSGPTTVKYSTGWVSADSASLENVINQLVPSGVYFTEDENLSTLMADGVNFIKNNGGSGNIVLLSNTHQYTTAAQANVLLGNILWLVGTDDIHFFTLNLDDAYQDWIWMGSNYFKGNDYLLFNLAINTGGEFKSASERTWNYSFWNYGIYKVPLSGLLDFMLPKMDGKFVNFSANILSNSGFSYSNYFTNILNGPVYFGSPVRMVGKFTGTPPLVLNIAGALAGGSFLDTSIIIDTPLLETGISQTKQMWSAMDLMEWFTYSQNISVIFQILQTSIENRVLSHYSAFLALEPGMSVPDSLIYSFNPPGQVGSVTGSSEVFQKVEGTSLQVFPNPVSTEGKAMVFIEGSCRAEFKLVDLNGKCVMKFSDVFLAKGENSVPFSVQDLPSGLYMLEISGDEFSETTKFMVLH